MLPFKKHKESQQKGGKLQQTRSKAFQQSLKKAKSEPFQLVLANLGRNEFTVYSVNSRNSYLALVTTTPHYECPYYMVKQNTQQLC